MADYYTYVSFTVTFESVAEAARAHLLVQEFEEGQHREGIDAHDMESTGCVISQEEQHLWFKAGDSVMLENLEMLLRHLAERFILDTAIIVEWSCGCSEPKTDAFGGGCLVVVRGQPTEWVNTGTWGVAAAKELARRAAQTDAQMGMVGGVGADRAPAAQSLEARLQDPVLEEISAVPQALAPPALEEIPAVPPPAAPAPLPPPALEEKPPEDPPEPPAPTAKAGPRSPGAPPTTPSALS